MEVKYKYTWFWNVDIGEYTIYRVTEKSKKYDESYFDTFEEAKDDLIRHLMDCTEDALNEIEMLIEETFLFWEKLQKANDITTWTE